VSIHIAEFLILLTVLVPAPKNLPEERGFKDQTAQEFQKTFDELHPQGWRLKRIRGFEKDGQSRFDSEWHKPASPPQFWCFHNIDRDEYEARTARIKNDGFVEVLKSTWKVDGKERVWTVWEMK
jgi:Polyglycine hydrolase-like, structural repeat